MDHPFIISTIEQAHDNDNDNNAQHVECPICNEPLDHEDIAYPIQCQTDVCHFNMCYSCTEKLLHASHEGPQVASDGNAYTTHLQCPSCRGSFLVDLEDVLLLREYDVQQRLKFIIDSELNAKDLRKKYQYSGDKLAEIERIKDCYFQKASLKTTGSIKNKDDHDKEEDHHIDYPNILQLEINHQDRETTKDSHVSDIMKKKIRYIDDMLLFGLESSMSDAERDFVVQLMTSGCTGKVVQATQLLASIIRMNAAQNRNSKNLVTKLDHVGHGGTTTSSGGGSSRASAHVTRSVGAAVSSQKRPSQPYIRPQSPNYTFRMSAASLPMKSGAPPTNFEMDTKQRLKWSKMYPLPFRMPRAMRLVVDFDPYDARHCPVRFMDDEDSLCFLKYNQDDYDQLSHESKCELIRDAFSTLSVSSRGKLIKKDGSRFDGVENIVSQLQQSEDGDGLAKDANRKVSWRRVIVSYVHGKIQRSTGLRVGDVVTHLDGEPLDGNAEKLRFLLAVKKREETIGGEMPTIELITNADVPVAEVLRLRSIAARKQQLDDDSGEF